MKNSGLRLGINIDHVATVRNARNRSAAAEPDLLRAALAALEGGADSITFHLREDRRHILDEDLARLSVKVKAPLNLEIAPTDEMRQIALQTRPFAVCLVPEKRHEVTTEGGLNVHAAVDSLKPLVQELKSAGIRVSMFINADPQQVEASARVGASAIELHTGSYAEHTGAARDKELQALQNAAKQAHAISLEVHAGHGLTYENVGPVAAIAEITELNIGHFLVGEAIFVGLAAAIRRMREMMDKARA